FQANALLRACAGLRILITSRQPLGITGEILFRVPSLDVPDRPPSPSPKALAEIASVQLFVERASAVDSAFKFSDDFAESIAKICRRLDGIPLAIELAAARTNTLTMSQIAERLDDCFGLLTGGSPTALPRHHTLRATVDWSYDLLTEEEKLLLRQLSV